MMKRIALVNPPFRPGYSRASRSPSVPRSGTLYMPHDLMLTAAGLRADGHTVLLIDAIAANMSLAALAEALHRWEPEVLVVAAAYPSLAYDIAAAARCKERALSARHLFLNVKWLEGELPAHDSLDGIITGLPLLPLRQWLRTGESMPALHWRAGLHVTPAPAAQLTAAEWPLAAPVAREFLPLNAYFYACAPHPVLTLRTRYGCDYQCAFCASREQSERRSVAQVLDELAWVEREWPEVRAVFFEDETFTTDADWLAEWCVSKPPRLAWSGNARADLDPAWLPRLAATGCYSLTVGFESRAPRTLAALHKGETPAQMEHFARAAAAAGIRVHGCFILGWPGETPRETRATIAWARRLPLDTAQFYPPLAEPGNALTGGVLVTVTAAAQAWCRLARRAFYWRADYWRAKARQWRDDPDSRYRLRRAATHFLPALVRGR